MFKRIGICSFFTTVILSTTCSLGLPISLMAGLSDASIAQVGIILLPTTLISFVTYATMTCISNYDGRSSWQF